MTNFHVIQQGPGGRRVVGTVGASVTLTVMRQTARRDVRIALVQDLVQD